MKHCLLVALLLLLATPVMADQRALPPGFDPQRHMLVAEVRDGMKGYGLSVFKGTKVERFEVEVVSVLKNFNPKYDVVLVRCKGANLEHTGAIAGMSGSPIYLFDDQGRARMVGAFAYGWPLVKDPIGGVQPIEYMLAIPDVPKKASEAHAAAGGSFNVVARADSLFDAGPNPRFMLGGGNGDFRLRPLATPMMVSGIPDSVLRQFEPMFKSAGIMALQAGAAAGAPADAAAKIEPGGAVAIPLLTGDANMTAVGTVTEVLGDRVLAFGHPFMSEGELSLPLGVGYIHTVVANIVTSFKLGAMTTLSGTVQADHAVGIRGKLGASPATVPIEIRCVYEDGSLDRTYRFNAVSHQRFTTVLSAMSAMTAVNGSRELPQYHTLDYDLTLEFDNGQTLRFKNRSVNSAAAEIVMAVAQPLMAAADNPFKTVLLKKLTGEVRVSRDAKLADILSVSLPRSKYQPGETVKAFVTHRPFRGVEAILPVEFALPRDLPNGTYDFAVLDAQQYLMEEQASRPFRFNADNADEVFAVLRDLASIRRDAIYVRLLKKPDGIAIGRTAMPNLPSSRRRVLMGAGLSNTTAFVSSAVKTVGTEYVMSGEARFSLTIDKNARVDVAARPALPESPKMEESKPKAQANEPAEANTLN